MIYPALFRNYAPLDQYECKNIHLKNVRPRSIPDYATAYTNINNSCI